MISRVQSLIIANHVTDWLQSKEYWLKAKPISSHTFIIIYPFSGLSYFTVQCSYGNKHFTNFMIMMLITSQVQINMLGQSPEVEEAHMDNGA